MANISSACGTFWFNDEFQKKHAQLIQEYFDKAKLDEFYGIYINDSDNGVFDFSGDGRWSMDNTLPWALCPIADSNSDHVKRLYYKLYKAMQKEKAVVTFDFDDYESGVQFNVHEIVEVTAWDDPDSDQPFKLNIKVEKDLGFDDATLINQGREDGYLMDIPEDRECFYNNEFESWYRKQSRKYQKEHLKLPLFLQTVAFLKQNDDFNGGILLWKADPDFLGEMVMDNVNNAFQSTENPDLNSIPPVKQASLIVFSHISF